MTNPLGLSREALERRRKYICAGDAARIMAGDLRSVWREKKGLSEGENLDDKLAVQMGSFTEPFNLWWCERQTGRPVEYFSENPVMIGIWKGLTGGRGCRHDEMQVSKTYPFMACSLDGMTTTAKGERCVIDAKHVDRSDEATILRYTAAGVHQATVIECDWWALSIFVGNGKWELIEQEVDEFYRADLIEREREFWRCVERDEEPPEDSGAAVLPPKPQPKLRTLILPTDQNSAVFKAMCRDENWLPSALPEIEAFVGTDGAAKRNAIARKNLLAAIPETIGDFQWGRYRAKRSKAGAVTMTVEKMEENDG